jgi:hypothetical protein
MKNIVYQNGENGILIESIPTFLGDCFIIYDTKKNKNVELMAMQFNAMMNRIETKDRDYGSFPHGGFDISDETVTIYHDDNRKKHEVILSIEELTDIGKTIS